MKPYFNHPQKKSYQKVETPIHDNIRGFGNLEVQRAWSEIMNVLANPKESVGRWNLNFLEA
jgi:hypothetical protein